MNVNINNILINVPDKEVQFNAQSFNKSDNSFWSLIDEKMADVILANGTFTNETLTTDGEIVVPDNIMNLILGTNPNGNVKISMTDNDITSKVIVNPKEVSDNDDETDISTDCNFLKMVIDIPYIYINYLNDEMSNNDIVNNVKFSTENLTDGENLNINEKLKGTAVNIFENQITKNNLLYANGSKEQKKGNVETPMVDNNIAEGLNGINEIKSSSLKETFDDEDKNFNDYFSDEIDMTKGEVVDLRNTINEDNFKIIDLSDESSVIKTSVLSQIQDKITMMTKDGTQHVTMELYPEKLGKIEIKMSFEKDEMTVEILSLNKDTQKLLISNSEELKGILNKRNDSNVNVVVKDDSDLLNHYGQNSSNLNYESNENRNYNSKDNLNYNYRKNKELNVEENIISEMINIRNSRLDQIV